MVTATGRAGGACQKCRLEICMKKASLSVFEITAWELSCRLSGSVAISGKLFSNAAVPHRTVRILLSGAILWYRDTVMLNAPNVSQDVRLITDFSPCLYSSPLHSRKKPYLQLHCPESNAVTDRHDTTLVSADSTGIGTCLQRGSATQQAAATVLMLSWFLHAALACVKEAAPACEASP